MAAAAPAPASPPSPPRATLPPADVSPPLLAQPPSDASPLVLAAPDAADGCDDNGINSNDSAGDSCSKAVAAVQVQPMPPFFVGNVERAPGQPVSARLFNKSESTDLSAGGGSKVYSVVHATHGVASGAWYFEARVLCIRPNTHIPKETSIGWATNQPDDEPQEEEELEAPVGFGDNDDIGGTEVEKERREKRADDKGDVFGFYIFLPDGERYYEPDRVVPNKDQQDAPPKVPGSEIRYFKNGVFQSIPYKDIAGGMYYPAALMYTSPKEPDYIVKFNFGPDFEFFPQDFGGLPNPLPMSEVPRQEIKVKSNGPAKNVTAEKSI